MLEAFRLLARYNRIANERLYDACSQLELAEYQRSRQGSFGSIHALLNHVLLGDRIWMSRFAGSGSTTPPLNTILFGDFSKLLAGRVSQDKVIEDFFETASADFLAKRLVYTNSQGKDCVETTPVAALHFFNHQTHHRGQIHVMISQTCIKPPSLDMHRILNP